VTISPTDLEVTQNDTALFFTPEDGSDIFLSIISKKTELFITTAEGMSNYGLLKVTHYR
jgi:hypothetical protein